MFLTAEQLKGKPAIPVEEIDVPEFGGKLRVRAWTGAEYDEFSKAIKNFTFDGAMFAAALAASAVGENGERLFDLNGDIERIATSFQKTTLESAFDTIKAMNRLGKEGLEGAEKN